MKKKESKRFYRYQVKVIIRPEGYNKIILEGIFVPKGCTCNAGKIKKQCWDYLSAKIDFKGHGLEPDMVEKEMIVKSIPSDFMVFEDRV